MTKPFWKLLVATGLFLMACQKTNNLLYIRITKQKKGYGYQILKDKNKLIDQPFIPAIQGEIAFKDSLQARRTAELVLKKIEKSSIPRISVNELDSMNIDCDIPKLP